MSASEQPTARRRRPLRQGIRCALCGQPVGKCGCKAFFLDPATSHLRSGATPLAALGELELEPGGVVEGTVSPVNTPGRSPVTTDEPDRQAGLVNAPDSPIPAPRVRRVKHFPHRRIHAVVLLGLSALALLAGALLFFLLPAPATIAIHPSSGVRSELVAITAVTTTPTPPESQARIFTSLRVSPRLLIRATGKKEQPALRATGTLVFYNIATYSQEVPAGIIFTVSGGIQVTNDSAFTLPAGNPPALGSASVPAHSLQPGAQGNIAAGTINGLCSCGLSGVSVKNTQFTGGQDAATYTVLTQDDIDHVATPARISLLKLATDDVKAQARPSERLAAPVQCSAHEALDQSAGSRTTQASVTVSATCQGEVYDQQDVEGKASAVFRQDMRRALPKQEVLAGSPRASIKRITLPDQQRGTLSLLVQVQGWWMYELNASRLSRQLAGKTYDEALSLLEGTSGIENVKVEQRGSGWLRLPDDPRQITIQIIPPPQAVT